MPVGIYSHKPLSVETKRKQSETRKRLYAEGKIVAWHKGKHWSDEVKRKISLGNIGKVVSEKTRKKMSIALKGKLSGDKHPLWGKHHTEEAKLKISIGNTGKIRSKEVIDRLRQLSIGRKYPIDKYPHFGLRGKHLSEETKLKISLGNMGKKLSEETKKKLSEVLKGRIPWNKGKGGKYHIHSEEYKQNMSKRVSGKGNPMYGTHRRGEKCPTYGMHHSEETKEKVGRASRERMRNPKYVEKLLKNLRLRPTKPEKKLIGIIQENNFPFKYVGDGSKVILRFNPDFICEERKLILECNGDYWHSIPKAIKKDEIKLKTYSELGYKTLIVWQNELEQPKQVVDKITNFLNT